MADHAPPRGNPADECRRIYAVETEAHDTEPLDPDGGQAPPRRYGRAVFLATVAGGLTSLWWGRSVWGRVSSAISPVEGLVPLVPTGGWRIYTVSGSMPRFDPATWKLSVGGLVERPTTFDYEQLRSLPRANQISTFHCVTGWTVENVRWGGVRIKDVLASANPLPNAQALEFTSMELPYIDYLTLDQAALPDVLLAYEMNGKPLPREHGAPVRLIIPDMYGYKSVKWLSRIDLVPAASAGYWEALGYDRDAWVGHSNGYGAAPKSKLGTQPTGKTARTPLVR
ncbi:MAG TPA: molybdopterin-dependent oxidoreductase [Gaiellaceae bacterium]|nr:molybdopterin-dependent oxidoreductase [Gaiellaceae bacterium]